MSRQALRRLWKPALLVALVAGGILAERQGYFDWQEAVDRAQQHADAWWLAAALVGIQIALFTFGLPGSLVIWAAGVVYRPSVATLVVVAGTLGGALGAYYFAATVASGWRQQMEGSRFLSILARRGGLLPLVAVRVLPTFPHSVINFGAGTLRLPLGRFLLATAIGMTVKGGLYVTAIHHAVEADSLAEALDWRVGLPLLGIAVLFLVAALIAERWGLRGKPPADGS
jgi:uncharacterized membrane protein YdjX (TVP38/TMEM64 family)